MPPPSERIESFPIRGVVDILLPVDFSEICLGPLEGVAPFPDLPDELPFAIAYPFAWLSKVFFLTKISRGTLPVMSIIFIFSLKRQSNYSCLVCKTEVRWVGTANPAHLLTLVHHFFFLRFGACVNADAATDFTVFDELGLRSNFEAFDATFFDVRSFRGILLLLNKSCDLSARSYKE